ncbi:hypothetical protein PHLH6_35010 [Pseudomonas sp. Seg1]|nr:hypothetical protein PHLH6_35010 [Pseudomonas sp. Seg1]
MGATDATVPKSRFGPAISRIMFARLWHEAGTRD